MRVFIDLSPLTPLSFKGERGIVFYERGKAPFNPVMEMERERGFPKEAKPLSTLFYDANHLI